MRCDTNFEVLMAYLDGELEPLERGRVAEHIVGCEECRRTVNDLRAVSGALTKWVAPEPAALPTAGELLERAGIARPAPVAAAPTQGNARRWLAAAALLLVSGVVGLVAINQLDRESPRESAKGPTSESAPPPPSPVAKPLEQPVPMPGAPAADGDVANTAPQTGAAQPPQPEEAAKQAEPSSTTERGVVEEGTPADTPDASVNRDAPPPPPAPAGAAAGYAPAPEPQPKPATVDERAAREDREQKGEADEASKKAKVARQRSNELQIRSGNITLTVQDASRAIGEIEAAARAASGSTSGQGSAVRRGGKTQRIITVRVPAERFDETFARIRGIGAASGEHKSSRDISDGLAVTDDAKERESLLDQTRTATIRVTVVASDN